MKVDLFELWWMTRVRLHRMGPSNIRALLNRPKVGEWVEDCRYQWHQVVRRNRFDLTLDDGSVCDWTACCGEIKSKIKPYNSDGKWA